MLGNRSPYPIQGAGGSGYLLQTAGQNILLDVGPGTLHNLDCLIDYHQLDAVIISHLHEDHWLDLYPLHYAIKRSLQQGQRKDALAVYLPFSEGIEAEYLQQKLGQEYHLQPIGEDKEIKLKDVRITFRQTQHSKECYALRVEQFGRALGYTADTAWDPSLAEFLADVDLMLAEATLLNEDQDGTLPHLTVQEAVELGHLARADKTILTHLGSEYDKEEIIRQIPTSAFDIEVSKVLKSYYILF